MPQVVDYSWARPTPQLIRDSGYVGAVRYLSYDPSKNLSPIERDALFTAGLAVGLVWETTASRALGGGPAGAEDAAEAERQADALGWPGDRPLYYAVDFDAVAGGPVTDYFHGATGAARRPVGIYGSYGIVEGIVGSGLVAWGWQAAAWSGGGQGTGGSIEGRRVSAHARLFQRATPVLGGLCDANDVLRPDWGGWIPATSPAELDAVRRALDDASRQILKEGSQGDAVWWAQLLLNRKLGPVLATDGIFGPRTSQAALAFQQNLRRYFRDPAIATDGVIGPQTWYYLLA